MDIKRKIAMKMKERNEKNVVYSKAVNKKRHELSEKSENKEKIGKCN